MTSSRRRRESEAARPVAPLAVTMGDPAGVGPEIISLALEDNNLRRCCLVVGNLDRLAAGARKAGSTLKYRMVDDVSDIDPVDDRVPVVHQDLPSAEIPFGKLSAEAGECAYRCLVRAIDMAMQGRVAGIVTAPLNKGSLHLAGHRFPGHTEILAERTGAEDYVMMLAAGGMRVLHVTTHMPVAAVPGALNRERILRVLHLGQEALVRMGIERPRFGVAGLNPHAGEGGIFGDEDVNIIAPAVEDAVRVGIDAKGPIAPDIVFLKMNRGHYDAVVAMYHDQGHIPLKLLAFESGVNITLGLPIIRTSVDHGTAFDIAGKGLADPGSLIEAIRLAASMAGIVIAR
ncbi:MAG: 4-hydroxythreonine-4-phosphate dehydrogenase PdxA [bacterium]|nr:MAG: 4-hydroxythreonine-4-phosphate dehydrogenase PdxA [bacterium]